jgi:hypothetical protein
MISDVLSQVVIVLDNYLNDPDYDIIYNDKLRERIIRLRDEAEYIRGVLDTPPASKPRSSAEKQAVKPNMTKFLELMFSDEFASYSREPYFSGSELKRRGWSEKLIDQILGGPDKRLPNPHHPNGAPMRCWKKDRVLATEDTPAFEEFRRRIKE